MFFLLNIEVAGQIYNSRLSIIKRTAHEGQKMHIWCHVERKVETTFDWTPTKPLYENFGIEAGGSVAVKAWIEIVSKDFEIRRVVHTLPSTMYYCATNPNKI